MFIIMTPLVFKKSPGALLASLTSWKCHGAKLIKKALLLMTAGYQQHKNPWYLPLSGFGSSSALHRALQGAKPPHRGPRLTAGFGLGRCMHLSLRFAICRIWQGFLTPCSCLESPHPCPLPTTLHLQEVPAQKQFCQQYQCLNRSPVLQSLSPALCSHWSWAGIVQL